LNADQQTVMQAVITLLAQQGVATGSWPHMCGIAAEAAAVAVVVCSCFLSWWLHLLTDTQQKQRWLG
jgi:hypothetical protein